MADKPRVIVLGGANGSGKTTASRKLLADTLSLMTFVNADVIAQGLSGFDPDASAITAGRIMLQRLDELAAQRADFAFETTLAARTYAVRLKALREAGYYVRLVYFWLPSADLNVSRVALRVRTGGHDVPEATIRQRYGRSVRNFLTIYRPLVHEWQVYDNTDPDQLELIADADESGERVRDEHRWGQFLRSNSNE